MRANWSSTLATTYSSCATFSRNFHYEIGPVREHTTWPPQMQSAVSRHLNRNPLFGIPTPESIHPLPSNRALSVGRLSRRRPERRSPASCKDRTAALIACSTSFSDSAASRGSFRPVSYHGGTYVTPWERAAPRSAVPWLQTVAA